MAIKTSTGDLAKVHKVSVFEDATNNISGPGSVANATYLTFSYTRENAANDVIYNGFMPFRDGGSYFVGDYISFDNGSTKNYRETCRMFMHGSGENGSFGRHEYGGIWQGSSYSGTSHTIAVGQSTRDGTGQNPFLTINPYQLSARQQNQRTELTLWEGNGFAVIT